MPAGPHRDLQTGGAAVIGHGQLQVSCHAGAVEEAALCADAAAAALEERIQKVRKLWGDGPCSSAATHPPASVGAEGRFFSSGGGAVLVAVSASLEQVWKTRHLGELQQRASGCMVRPEALNP